MQLFVKYTEDINVHGNLSYRQKRMCIIAYNKFQDCKFISAYAYHHVIPCVPKLFRNASAICTSFPLGRNLMQIGGSTLKRPSSADGRYHIPSPDTKPAATAAEYSSALCLCILVQISRNIVPRAMSTAKVGPERNGSANAVIQGM